MRPLDGVRVLELGQIIAAKLNQARGPVTLFIPLRGISMIATEGGSFYDSAADRALIDSLKAGLSARVAVRELDLDINDPRFAVALADELHAMIARD